MAQPSLPEKKAEFQSYLEKGKVLPFISSFLTELFEMENKPQNPLNFMAQRLTEAIAKENPANGRQADPATDKSAMATEKPASAPEAMAPAAHPVNKPASAPVPPVGPARDPGLNVNMAAAAPPQQPVVPDAAPAAATPAAPAPVPAVPVAAAPPAGAAAPVATTAAAPAAPVAASVPVPTPDAADKPMA